MTPQTTFKQVVQSEAELREILGYPGVPAKNKTITELDDICRAFIEKSPFLLIASSNEQGSTDVSPKGDPPGFVQVLDSKTLLIPDRPGNRRGDTLSNILQNPNVGLLFLIPGKRDTLRVNGTAQIIRDEDLRERFAVQGKPPIFLIAVTVEEAFLHCTKCVIRSNLWDGVNTDAVNQLATLGEAIVKHAKLDLSIEEVNAILVEDESTGLY